MACALLAGRDPLEAVWAAGSLLLGAERRRDRLLAAAVATHLGVSLGWALVLSRALPDRRAIPLGSLAGLAIAGLDLGVIGRRLPRIRALPQLPQLADHVTYGATVAAVLAARRRRRNVPDRRAAPSRGGPVLWSSTAGAGEGEHRRSVSSSEWKHDRATASPDYSPQEPWP